MRYLVPGPTPCPEVVAVFYIRPAKVPTLFSVEGDAQVEQQNTVVGFLTYIAEYEVLVEMAGYDPNSWLTLKIFTDGLPTELYKDVL